MGEKEDKEKAEKLAAAKKRVAQLQKKKKAAGGGGSVDKSASSAGAKGKGKKTDKDKDVKKEKPDEEDDDDEEQEQEKEDVTASTPAATAAAAAPADASGDAVEDVDDDENAFNEAIKAAQKNNEQDETDARSPTGSPEPKTQPSTTTTRSHPARQQSISLQSKIRSASFRQGATPTSPGLSGDNDDHEFPDIYRKQMARIDELEKENKRLAAEAQESRARWQKSEEELEEVRERAVEVGQAHDDEESDEVLRLRGEIDMLRRGSKASISGTGRTKGDGGADAEVVDELKKEVESKEGTISDMQLEISRLRTQLSTQSQGKASENEQIAALQDSLRRSEESNAKMSIELQDSKKALKRASEKAVVDGTERTSKDTKLRALERELDELKSAHETSEKKVETLEKKIEAMNKLHRESDQRNAPKLASADQILKDLQLTKAKLESVEKENLRLREARKHRMSGDGAEEGLDELEDEDRQKLERRIRDLEGENFDLRRGVWRDRRKELQPNLSAGTEGTVGAGGVGGDDFDEVDLNGSGAASRKASAAAFQSQQQTRHSGFTQVINSGLAAFRASTTSPDSSAQRSGPYQSGTNNTTQVTTRPRNDSLLEDFDDEALFDEGAFAAAQREEEMRKMVEHVREVKKGLKAWAGWRLDLVELRRSSGEGVGGFGQIFDV